MDQSSSDDCESSAGSEDEKGCYDVPNDAISNRQKLITDQLKSLLNVTPHSYEALLHRANRDIFRRRASSGDSSGASGDESGILEFRTGPIVLRDPEEDEHHDVQIVKRPYLKRGAGLARYHMTMTDFQTPPDIYKKKEFKSYLKTQQRAQVKQSSRIETSHQHSVISANKPIKKKVDVLSKSSRLNQNQIVKKFDNEIIPTHRPKPSSSKVSSSAPKGILLNKVRELVRGVPEIEKPVLATNQNFGKIDQFNNEKKENLIFETLEQRVQESDFSVNNTSVQEILNGNLTSTPKKIRESNENFRNVGDDGKTDDYKIIEENIPTNNWNYTQRNVANTVRRKALKDNVKELLEYNVNNKKRLTSHKVVKKVKLKKPRAVRKETVTMHQLKSRLDELEKEKNKFQIENDKLKRAQKQVFDEKQKLDKLRRDNEKSIADAKNDLFEERDKLYQDQRKLQREKQVFESYCEETKKSANREEREEIRNLKKELETLKESIKTKEARWGSSQARLRNHVKHLEDENIQLKNELDLAKKAVAKKVSFEQKPVTSAKMIDAINKALDKRLNGDNVLSDKSSLKSDAGSHRRSKSVEHKSVLKPGRGRSLTSVEPLKRNCNSPEIINLVNGESVHESLEKASREKKSVMSKDSCGDLQQKSTLQEQEITMSRSESADSGVCSQRSDVESAVCGSSNGLEDNEDVPIRPCDCQRKVCIDDAGACFTSAPATYSAILELKQRVGDLAAGDCFGLKNISSKDPQNFDRSKLSSNTRTCVEEIETVSSNGNVIRKIFPNGDIKETYLRNTCVKYLFRQSGIWQTTYKDRPGYQQLDMPDGRTVVYHPDGSIETLYKNGTMVRQQKNGYQEWRFTTGEIVRNYGNEEKIIVYPDGRKEISNKDGQRLEHPDGTVKTIDKDGIQKTRYPNGQVRVKDRFGNLLLDMTGFTSHT